MYVHLLIKPGKGIILNIKCEKMNPAQEHIDVAITEAYNEVTGENLTIEDIMAKHYCSTYDSVRYSIDGKSFDLKKDFTYSLNHVVDDYTFVEKQIASAELKALSKDRVISIDFETANNNRASVCSIGYVVEDLGEIIAAEEILVNPDTNFSNINTKIHGITQDDVVNAPKWPEAWSKVENYITEDTLVVAHNIRSMELACIRKECERYDMPIPDFAQKGSKKVYDTLKISNTLLPELESHTLINLCSYYDIKVENYHNALCDAKACLNLFNKFKTIDSFKNIELNDNYKGSPSSKNPQNFSKDNPFVHKKLYLWSPFEFGYPKEMTSFLYDIGAMPSNRFDKSVDYLIVGNTHKRLPLEKSYYIKEALELNNNGANIEILYEDELFSILEKYKTNKKHALRYKNFKLDSFLKNEDDETKKYFKNEHFYLTTPETLAHYLDFTDYDWSSSKNTITIKDDSSIMTVEFLDINENTITIKNIESSSEKKYDYSLSLEELIEIISSSMKETPINNDLDTLIDSSNISSVDFVGKAFCLSGNFEYGSKKDVEEYICSKGGTIDKSVKKKTDYVVVGAAGSDAYANGNYGTKVKKAMENGITVLKENQLFE